MCLMLSFVDILWRWGVLIGPIVAFGTTGVAIWLWGGLKQAWPSGLILVIPATAIGGAITVAGYIDWRRRRSLASEAANRRTTARSSTKEVERAISDLVPVVHAVIQSGRLTESKPKLVINFHVFNGNRFPITISDANGVLWCGNEEFRSKAELGRHQRLKPIRCGCIGCFSVGLWLENAEAQLLLDIADQQKQFPLTLRGLTIDMKSASDRGDAEALRLPERVICECGVHGWILRQDEFLQQRQN